VIADKLTHEHAVLKRLKFAARSERFSAEQRSLLEEALDADLQALAEEIERLEPAAFARPARQQPTRRRDAGGDARSRCWQNQTRLSVELLQHQLRSRQIGRVRLR
jgi:hypothetical protein